MTPKGVADVLRFIDDSNDTERDTKRRGLDHVEYVLDLYPLCCL